MFGMLMLLSAFTLGGSPALAANTTRAMHDTKDVCADIESADDKKGVDNESDKNDAEDTCEKAESVKLASQVDVSETKARLIAETNYSGKGKITELLLARDEDEHNVSRIVYEIEFTNSDKTQVNVKVDAQTGKYLGIDTEDDNDGENTSDDTPHVKGTANIQTLQMQLVSLLQQLIALLKA